MARRVTVRCAHCNAAFSARTVDRERGWAKFCSKSCKALSQARRSDYLGSDEEHDDLCANAVEGDGWDAHKVWR
jgi:hypothetical protein